MLKALYIWLIAAALLGLLFSPFLHCVLIGLTLAVVLYPLYHKFSDFLTRPVLGHGWRLSQGKARNLAAFAAEIAALVVMVVGLLLPAFVLYHNRHFFAEKSIQLYQNSVEWSRSQKLSLSHSMEAPAWIDLSSERPDVAVLAPPVDNFKQFIDSLPSLGSLALLTVSSLILWSVRLMLFFMVVHVGLLYGPEIWVHILEHARQPWRSILERLGWRAKEVLRAVYVIHGLTALAAFLIAVPVFWFILGQPYFFLVAVMAGLFQFLPLVGSVVLVSALTLYFFMAGQMDRGWLCLLLAWPLVVAVPDLIIRPALARSQGKINALTMMIGFMTGIEALGPAGFVLGPLIFELFVSFTRIMLYGPDPQKSPQKAR